MGGMIQTVQDLVSHMNTLAFMLMRFRGSTGQNQHNLHTQKKYFKYM